eukprot:3558648-Amphidinium_carterae.1
MLLTRPPQHTALLCDSSTFPKDVRGLSCPGFGATRLGNADTRLELKRCDHSHVEANARTCCTSTGTHPSPEQGSETRTPSGL